MKLQILSPDKQLFEGEVISVKVPGAKGSFEILNQHAPIISALDSEGDVRIITPDNKSQLIAIKGGVVEVNNNLITILTEA